MERRALDEVLGLDGLKLKVPITRPVPRRFDATTTRQRRNSHRFHHGHSVILTPHLGFDITVNAYSVPDRGWWAKVQFNPRHHPLWRDRWHPCPLPLLNEVLHDVWDAVDYVVDRNVPTREARVDEIHVARDHNVSPELQRTLLRSWSTHKVPNARRRPLWHSPDGLPESFSTGTKRQGLVRGYDHSAKHGSPVGTFRIEVEAHQAWAGTYGGIEVLADIDAAAIERLYLDRYRYAGLHLPVVHHGARLHRLYELTHEPDPLLTVRQLPGFVGREHLAENGIVLSDGSTTRANHHKVIERIGLAHSGNGFDTVILDPHHDEPLVVSP